MRDMQIIFLVFAGFAAVCSDVRERRIPNRWLLAALLVSLAGTALCFRPRQLARALLGAAEPLILFSVLFHFRMIGAGDIKLLAVFGSCLGPVLTLRCIGLSIAFGAVMAAALAVRSRNLAARFRYLFRYAAESAVSGRKRPYVTDRFGEGTFSFSLPVYLAFLATLAAGR